MRPTSARPFSGTSTSRPVSATVFSGSTAGTGAAISLSHQQREALVEMLLAKERVLVLLFSRAWSDEPSPLHRSAAAGGHGGDGFRGGKP